MDIRLSFLGAAKNVTGSRYLLQANGRSILVDCGLYQERAFRKRNWEPFPVSPESLDAVLLTHAHLDHCGFLPKLVKEGFRGKIHCTAATVDIAQIVLKDSGRIQEEDAEYKRKRHDREGRKGPFEDIPLYTVEDAERCISLFSSVGYEQAVDLGGGLRASFHDAGHILGSSMIRVKTGSGPEGRTVLFSGDIGRWNMPILRDPTEFAEADYVLMESTYGDRLHEDAKDTEEILAEVITRTGERGGNVVIPSFAVGRTQELLYHLNRLLLADRIPHLMVFIDSPMASRVTEVFKKHPGLFDEEMNGFVQRGESPFNLPNLKMVSSVQESKAINHIKGTAIVIAGSGMCTGGRIKHHLVNNLARPESTILFVGYQATGTLGREIASGAREARILGQTYPVRAQVSQIHGFSAHADRDELFRWAGSFKKKPRGIFVTHGEAGAAGSFAEMIREKAEGRVLVPDYRDELTLA